MTCRLRTWGAHIIRTAGVLSQEGGGRHVFFFFYGLLHHQYYTLRAPWHRLGRTYAVILRQGSLNPSLGVFWRISRYRRRWLQRMLCTFLQRWKISAYAGELAARQQPRFPVAAFRHIFVDISGSCILHFNHFLRVSTYQNSLYAS